MRRDVIRIEGDLLVFGGPYRNIEATEALLTEAGRLGIPPEAPANAWRRAGRC
jgi:hypothetical protein